jgi:ATP-dependent Clp protease adapter protein ClpS
MLIFETDDSLDLKSKKLLDEKINELLEREPVGKFAVVLHNDPLNGVDYVARIIKSVFNYSTKRAVWLMLQAHFLGSSQLWSGPKNEALAYINKIVSAGPDPAMQERGAEPLKVTLELQA